MTSGSDPYVVVVTSNSDLAAALPFHCTLRVEYDVATVTHAAVIVIDQRSGRSVREELDRLSGVPLERVVVISDEEHGIPVGATVTRPVSIAELCHQLESVASRSDEPAAALGPQADTSVDGVAEKARPTARPEVPTSKVMDPEPSVIPATAVSEGQDGARAFFQEVDDTADAARAVLALLARHPVLRDPDVLIAAVAEEALQGLRASMLSMWRRGPVDELSLIGGVGLGPTERQRELAAAHPLLATALDEGGVLITSVSDEPARVAGLPGAYCESLVLLPVDVREGLSLLVVAGGDGLDQTSFDQIERCLVASTSLLDWAVTLQRLRATLDV